MASRSERTGYVGVKPLVAAHSPRVRGLAEWNPQQKTLVFLDIIKRVLDEYAAYLPLTIRQIYYRLVGAHGYDKTERAYKNLGECLGRARRAGVVSFDAIRDDGANVVTSLGWDDLRELIGTWRNDANYFRLDRQQGQPHRLLFLVEAAGMKPQIEAVAGAYGIPVIPSGGFDSLTFKYQLARALGEYDGLTEPLHIGDHDPSGGHVFLSAAEDVEALIDDMGLPGRVQFTRLAVTPEQIRRLHLPTAPPKTTDNRAFEGATTQAEAIPPDILAKIVRDAITKRLDRAAYQAVLTREKHIRQQLTEKLDRFIDDDDNGEGVE
jgi:hypothetical protein